MTPLVIAIDGPAAAGKGTLARSLAARLGLPHLDTGLLYRIAGRRALDAGADLANPQAVLAAATGLGQADLSRTDLRGPAADAAASAVAQYPAIRAMLLDFQRQFPAGTGAVLDGRDIGTIVFPGAQVKLFVTADLPARAHRRWLELGGATPLATIQAEMQARDARDSQRGAAPLRQAEDAALLDTTGQDAPAVLAAALEIIRKRTGFP